MVNKKVVIISTIIALVVVAGIVCLAIRRNNDYTYTDENIEKNNSKNSSVVENKVTENKVAENKVPENKVENTVVENKVSENKNPIIIMDNLAYRDDAEIVREWNPKVDADELVALPYAIEIYDDYRE